MVAIRISSPSIFPVISPFVCCRVAARPINCTGIRFGFHFHGLLWEGRLDLFPFDKTQAFQRGFTVTYLLYGQFYPTMGCLRVSNSLWFVTDGVNFSFLRWCDQPFEIEYSTEAHWGLTTKGNRGKQTYFWSFTLDNLLVSSLLRV